MKRCCMSVQSKTFFFLWLPGLSVHEVEELGEAKGTTLAYELEKALMSKFGIDQDRIRDEFKHKFQGFWAPKNLM